MNEIQAKAERIKFLCIGNSVITSLANDIISADRVKTDSFKELGNIFCEDYCRFPIKGERCKMCPFGGC